MCVCVCTCLVAKLCPTLFDPTDCILPDSSIHGFPRQLGWVAISFSRGSSPPRDWTWVSCTAGGFFTCRAFKPLSLWNLMIWTQSYLYMKHPSLCMSASQRHLWAAEGHQSSLIFRVWWRFVSVLSTDSRIGSRYSTQQGKRHFPPGGAKMKGVKFWLLMTLSLWNTSYHLIKHWSSKLPLRLWFLVGYFFHEENEAQRGNFLRYFIRWWGLFASDSVSAALYTPGGQRRLVHPVGAFEDFCGL